MLYLVGGVSRSGKSTLAERLRIGGGVPWLPLDALKMGLFLGAPVLRVHPEDPDLETADRMWPIVRNLAENLLFDGRDYLIEGVNLRPATVKAFIDENAGAVAACFLGYPDLAAETKAALVAHDVGRPNDWLSSKGEAYIGAYLEACRERSAWLQHECNRLGLAFFDTGADFEAGLADAARHLLAG